MKKFLFSLVLFCFLSLPLIGLTQGVLSPEEIPALGGWDVMRIAEEISNWLFSFLLIAAVIMIVVSGFLFVTAAGNSEKVTKARNFLIYALIGVVVAILARGLVALVRMMIGG